MDGPKPPATCRITHEGVKTACIILAVIFILLTFVNVLVATIFVARQDTIFRICFTALPQNVVGNVGEVGARASGMITIDQNTDAFSYQVQTVVPMSSITAVHIRGPLPLGQAVAPIAQALCGIPNVNACDALSVPGQVVGQSLTIYDGALVGAMVRPLFNAMRSNPQLYYIEILTNVKPVTPGAVRADVTGTCGFA